MSMPHRASEDSWCKWCKEVTGTNVEVGPNLYVARGCEKCGSDKNFNGEDQ